MDIFLQFSLLVALAAGVSIIMRLLKQPLIIGHIITGLIAGTFIVGILPSYDVLHLFSEIGIAILLFLVGLHLHPDNIKRFGKISLITGFGQVIFTTLAGILIAHVFIGFDLITSLYISVAYAFSSTIIILKLISDKGDTESLYGRISIGFLLVQDFIAIFILFLLPLVASGDFSAQNIILLLARGTLLLAAAYIVSQHIIPRIGRFMERSHELLFLFTIAWGLIIAALFNIMGFGIESGALIAGITLATMPSRHEITARLTPLRDFFIIMFFVILGAQMTFGDIVSLLPYAGIFGVLILVGNPVILMSIMGFLGYTKKTSLKTGFTVAQISEFSLIVIALGARIGHLSDEVVALSTLVALITIFGSTYMITYSDSIYNFLEPYLGIFERKQTRDEDAPKAAPEILLFGAGRVGHEFYNLFKDENIPHLIVDHNPDIIDHLSHHHLNGLYGDASTVSFIEALPLEQARLIVSTIPDTETNITLFETLKELQEDLIFIGTATKQSDVEELYAVGFDYVIMPHYLGATHATGIFKEYGYDKERYRLMKTYHQKDLERFYELKI